MIPCPGRWQRRPTERRPEILAAARIEFGTLGYAKATLAGVAERAGVSAATVSHYFGTKAGLFEAMVSEEALCLAAAEPVLMVGPEGYRGALHELVASKWRRMSEPGMAEMVLAVLIEKDDFPDSARQLFRQLSERGRQRFEAVIAGGVAAGEFAATDPRRAAQAIQAFLVGVLLDTRFIAGCTDAQPCCEGAIEQLQLMVDRLVGATPLETLQPANPTDG